MKQIDKYKMLSSLIDTINYSEVDKTFKSFLEEFLNQVSAASCYDRPLRASILKMLRAHQRQEREYARLLKEDELKIESDRAFARQIDNPRYTY